MPDLLSMPVLLCLVLALCLGIALYLLRSCRASLHAYRQEQGQGAGHAQEAEPLSVQAQTTGRLALLGKASAEIAHETAGVLSLIRETAGWMGDLLEDEDPKALQHHSALRTALGNIIRHVDRAASLSRNVLSLARPEQGDLVPQEMNALVEQMGQFLLKQASYRQVALSWELDEQNPLFRAKAGQFEQVLFNLLDNAIDAMDTGGTIRMRVSSSAETVCCTVHDTGPGIAAHVLPHLFSAFVTTKSAEEGTGLGLSITHSIVQRLGGHIHCENDPAGGAVFTVTVPRYHN